MLASHKDLKRKLAALEKKYDDQIKIVFEAIAELMTPSDDPPQKKIGFEVREKKGAYRKKTKKKKAGVPSVQ